jgi:hypothetical protein
VTVEMDVLLQGQVHRRAAVMKCLLSQLDDLGGVCETEVSRAARMALWEYTPGADRPYHVSHRGQAGNLHWPL